MGVAMVECNMAASTPFVVAVSGTSGAGNTTLVHGLIEASATAGITAASLKFDDFAASSILEADLSAWLSRGGSPNDWRTDEMVEVLGRLTTERGASSPKPGTPFDLVVVEAIWPGTTATWLDDRPRVPH